MTEAPQVILLDSSSPYEESSCNQFVKALTSERLRVSCGSAQDVADLGDSEPVHVVSVRNPDLVGVLANVDLHRVGSICLVSHRWSAADIEFVARLDLPLLVVHGQADRVTPVAHADAAVKRASNGRLVAVTGADHMLPAHLEVLVAGLVRVHVAQAQLGESETW